MMDVEEIKVRVEAATPSPWNLFGSVLYSEKKEICKMSSTRTDAQFIAHAREDIPALISEVDRLTAENITLRAERDALLKSFSVKPIERGE